MASQIHQPHDCLLNRLCRRRSKKIPKLRVAGLCAGNSPVTGEFHAQMASNAENVSIWRRRHGLFLSFQLTVCQYRFRLCFVACSTTTITWDNDDPSYQLICCEASESLATLTLASSKTNQHCWRFHGSGVIVAPPIIGIISFCTGMHH